MVVHIVLPGDKIVCSSGAFDIDIFVDSLSKNTTMNGYPKILIFDFCRGNTIDVGVTKSGNHIPPKIPFGSDIFIGFATAKGSASATAPTGSQFHNILRAAFLHISLCQ
jgi:hypothetical protein